MPKVREVFERAYGPVPEGATCHALYLDFRGSLLSGPVIPDGQHVLHGYQESYVLVALGKVYGPDISDRDAEAFRGFFDAAYDAALDALTKEEAEDSIHPDEIIKIANALAKFVSQGGDTKWAKDMAGYYLAASGIYERVSAGGTGESPVLSTHLDVMGEEK